jgi:hypothetical protein
VAVRTAREEEWKMRIALCIAAAAALVAGTAVAKDAISVNAAAKDAVQAQPGRVVYVCNTDAITKRGFARQFGSAEFVTADQAVAKGEAWSQPKCITPLEARRLKAKTLASAR